MEKLKLKALENHIPIVRDKTASVLMEKCKEKNPKRILEIGTAIGYSCLLMLQNCDAFVVTIEKNEDRMIEAKENIKQFGQSDRVDFRLSDALEELKKIDQSGDKFDFVFLDGAKGQYLSYYPYIKSILNKDGILFADNIDLNGLVLSPERITHKNRAMATKMIKFLDQIKNDQDFKTEFYHIDDGFLIAEKLF